MAVIESVGSLTGMASTSLGISVEQIIWWLNIIGHVLVYLRLRQNGLTRIYPSFSWFLLFRVARSVSLIVVPWVAKMLGGFSKGPFESNAYAWTWVSTEPIMWFLYVLVVLEMYSLVLQNYRGLASLSRWVVLGGLGIAVAISGATLSVDLSNTSETYPALRLVFAIDRGIVSSLVVFLLIVTLFLRWCPVPLSRNVVVHCIVYAVYFLGLSGVFLFRNVLGPGAMRTISTAFQFVTTGCLGVWFFMLNQQGETVVVVPFHSDPEVEHSLAGNMAAINASLLRAARK